MKKCISIFKKILLFLIFINFIIFIETALAQETNPLFQTDQCIVCHLEIDLMPEDFNEHDIHLQSGLSCSGCHGGDHTTSDQEEAMNTGSGFVGIPTKQQTPQFCGKCHSNIEIMRQFQPRISTDQENQYYTSQHGQKLQKGDKKVAECVGCHTAHSIFTTKDPRSTVHALRVPETCKKCHSDAEYMKEYGLATDQYEKFTKSIHGINLLQNRDTGSPACNDCHGNHGASPPGVESVSHVCGGCHVNNMNYFSNSPMNEPFQESDLHACEQCHGYHEVLKTNDKMVGVGESSICIKCHSEGDKGYQAAESMYAEINKFDETYQEVELLLKEVQQKGMNDEEILFLLLEAKQNLIHTRTLTHTFDPEKIREKSDEGIKQTNQAVVLAQDQLREYTTRRRGFGFAILFIFVLAAAMILKIWQMERKVS